ncbi:MAG: PRC-barrel domain-containing protein [Gaiellaceae bacterium]
MSGDPVSWLVIEKGWKVVGADGKELGKVHEVIGDTTNDIFSGLAVTPGLLGILHKPRFVPSESVLRITEGQIDLDLDSDAFDRVEEHSGVAT